MSRNSQESDPTPAVVDGSPVWTQDPAIGLGLYHQDLSSLLQLLRVAGRAVHLLPDLAWLEWPHLHSLHKVVRRKSLFQKDTETFLRPELHLKFVDLRPNRNSLLHLLVMVSEDLRPSLALKRLGRLGRLPWKAAPFGPALWSTAGCHDCGHPKCHPPSELSSQTSTESAWRRHLRRSHDVSTEFEQLEEQIDGI